ncbi:hypothetical protein HDV00_001978 [Rhizophlyctis rosea]|nr:hypothetical protein HDV00_001978 [Rhizophlyctis rosea]
MDTYTTKSSRRRSTSEEDAAIIQHIRAAGKGQWAKLAKELNRPEVSLRNRWRNVLSRRVPDLQLPKRNPKQFTMEEDALIIRLIEEEKLGWSQIGRQVGCRWESIRYRWQKVLQFRAREGKERKWSQAELHLLDLLQSTAREVGRELDASAVAKKLGCTAKQLDMLASRNEA